MTSLAAYFIPVFEKEDEEVDPNEGRLYDSLTSTYFYDYDEYINSIANLSEEEKIELKKHLIQENEQGVRANKKEK